ncbi:MAG: hypothetical protein IPK52_20345 [Chloroflexi bacterium]|nr:hypothetical protein [Chloroflexota bacterium]
MTRQFPAFLRVVLLLLCAALLLGTAIAQDRLGVPTAPDTESSGETPLDQAPLPTVQPMVPPENGLGRFDLNSDTPPVAPLANLEAVTRTTYDGSKLDSALSEMLHSYVRGDLLGSEGITRNFFLPQDQRGRFLVIVHGATGVRGRQVSNIVERAGGIVQYSEANAVFAKLDALQIAVLSLNAKIIQIQPQLTGGAEPEPTSDAGRSPVGSVYTEGFDVANAQEWHTSGNTGGVAGDRINVGIIDFGFGSNPTASTELTCLNSYPSVSLILGTMTAGDTRRGLDMAEVVCDIAPGSRVRLYKVTTSNDLYDAINTADSNNDVIIIGADFGPSFSPGDGTFGRSSAKNVYQALATAKANGVVVLAAAGNSHQAYRSFPFVGTTVTLGLKLRPGDRVNLGWNDWDDLQNGGGVREDITGSLSGAGFTTINKPGRSGSPVWQIAIPATCTVNGQGFCTGVVLSLDGLSGDASSVVMQVNITGGTDREITSLSGATALSLYGSISRPADSPDVIAVGAVCVDFTNNFPQEDYSAQGPIYGAGGGQPPSGPVPLTAFDVKPDVVGPSHVSVFPNQLAGISGCNLGLDGTQASAAHVGAMAALLLYNDDVAGFSGLSTANNVAHYLRTHSIDLPLAANPAEFLPEAGYDYAYGAGLPVLGQPDFDYDESLTAGDFAAPNRVPAGECLGGFVYVGPRNAGNNIIGSGDDYPYQSIMQAAYLAAQSPEADCVIVLPGEYSTPLYLSSFSQAVGIYGYRGVTLNGGIKPSTLVVQNRYWGDTILVNSIRSAGIYVFEGSGTTIGGLDFHAGQVFADADFYRAQVLAVDNADDFTFTRADVSGITSNQTLIEVFGGSQGAEISDSTFLDNIGQAGASLIAVYNSGGSAAANRVQIRGNVFENNRHNEGDWLASLSPATISINWVPMIRSLDSYVDIISNTMRSNEAETLLQGATSAADTPFEFRVLGNVIVDSTISSNDGFTPGPLIHGFFQRYMVVINNTIAQTDFVGSGPPYNTLIARGDDIPNNGTVSCADCGSLSEVLARIELRGNLFMNNQSAELIRELDGNFGSGFGCVSFAGPPSGTDKGAQNNWVSNSGGNGNCSTALTTPANNNVVGTDPTAQLDGGPDVTRPEYYAPKSTGVGLIDAGPDAFLSAGANNLTDFLDGRDVRGDLRQNVLIDIGAYEYTPFFLLDPLPITRAEDSGVIEFDINDPLYIEGGFPPYTATVVSGQYPDFYGSHCDSRFTSPLARGTAIEFVNNNTLTIAYCPPRHFNTDTAGVPSGLVELTIELTDARGASNQTTIEYTITPVDDSDLVTPLGDNTPAGDVVTTAVSINRAAAINLFRLRPYVDFGNNFFFSETNNSIQTASKSEVDFDFTYTLPTLVVGDPINDNPTAISDHLTVFNPATGVVGVDTTALTVGEATARLTYTVTDRNLNQVTNFIVVQAVAPPAPFLQTAPVDNFVVNNIDTLSGFAWEFSAGAGTYDLLVERIIEEVRIPTIALTGMISGTTSGFVCTTTCTYTLTPAQKQLLVIGDYEWTVHADNKGLKLPATNAPLVLTVNTGKELIVNGDFEQQGASSAQALAWTLTTGTGDKRKCGAGINNSCLFEFSSNNTTVAVLSQKPAPIGRTGDNLLLSAAIKTKSLLANIGIVQVIVKHTTGDKTKLKLTAPSGTHDFALQTSAAQVLPFPVTSYKVKLKILLGSGKMSLDNVSLVLDEEIAFDLLSPGDNATVVADSGYITELTWESSASASSYDVQLIKTLGPVDIIDATFTSAADTDDVTCGLGVCVLTLDAPLADGDYVWTVTASNGTTASNAPSNFTVDTTNLTELVKNGDFEEKNASSLPKQWTAAGVKTSVVVCESGLTHPEYQGLCGFIFFGQTGLNATLTQTLPITGLAINDRLTLRGAAQIGKAVAGAEIKLQVTYTDNTKVTRKLTQGAGSSLWQALEADPITLTKAIKKAVVTLSYKGISGKVTFDNISVISEDVE